MSGQRGTPTGPVEEVAAGRAQAGSRGLSRMWAAQAQVAAVGVREGPDPEG